jgi:hypothetical protein
MKLIIAVLSLVLVSASSLMAALPTRFHEFAQVADGGGYRSIIWISNQNAQSVDVTIKFFTDLGTPLTLTLDGTTGITFTITVPAGQSKKLATAGTATVTQAGWAQLVATGEVGAQLQFEISNGGQLITQAAVESSGPLDNLDIFVDESVGHTGVAFANYSASGSIAITLTLKDQNGAPIATNTITLLPFGHKAIFVYQLFTVPAGTRGTMRVQSSGPVSAVTLQMTGLVIGTLPVIPVFP